MRGCIVLACLLMLSSENTAAGQPRPAEALGWSKCCLSATGAWQQQERRPGYGQVSLRGWHVSPNAQKLWAVGSIVRSVNGQTWTTTSGLILHSNDGGLTWTRKQIATKRDLTAVFAAADGMNVWVAAVTDYGPSDSLTTGLLYQSSDAGEHWAVVPGMSVPIDHLTGTPDGKHLWAASTYARVADPKAATKKSATVPKALRPATGSDVADALIRDREMQEASIGQKLYHLVDGALKSATDFKFDRFRHGIASSDDGMLLSSFDVSGTTVMCSVDGGTKWTKCLKFDTRKLPLYRSDGDSATATPEGHRIALTDGSAAFYSPDSGASWLAKSLGRRGFDMLTLMPSQLLLLSADGELRKVPLASFKRLSTFRPGGSWH